MLGYSHAEEKAETVVGCVDELLCEGVSLFESRSEDIIEGFGEDGKGCIGGEECCEKSVFCRGIVGQSSGKGMKGCLEVS